MRACRERRSVVKYTFSLASSPLPLLPLAGFLFLATPLDYDRRVRRKRTKRVGGVVSVLKREGDERS